MSPEVTMDRRKKKTNKILKEALISLMNEKDFHSITVSDITRVADINRATFYSHFHDKYHLLEQLVEEILKEFEGLVMNYYAVHNSTKKPVHLYLSIFQHIKDRGDFYKITLIREDSSKFWRKLLSIFFLTVNKNKQIRSRDAFIPEDIFNSFVSAAFIGVIINWLKNDMNYPPEFMAEKMYYLYAKMK